MKNHLLLLTALILSIFIVPAGAWNANGHVLISQLAYEKLTESAQKKVDKLSERLFKQLAFSTQHQLNRKYPNVSDFAKLSLLPDQVKKQPLIDLFEQYGGKLPTSLENLAKADTKHWHFTTHPYPKNCPVHPSKQDIIWSIQTLKPIVKNEQDALSQALSLMLLTHFIEDIHQPLHTFSKADESCKLDKGGNLFCLSPSFKGEYCKHNLHHLWDTGVGFLKGRQTNLSRKMALIKEAKEGFTEEKIKESDPTQWGYENYAYADFIYSLKPNQRPSKAYYQEGQAISKRQMALASYRLAYLLNDLLGH